MDKLLTKIRVDRHEVSFFVSANPNNKTASDVAKMINDGRLKQNIYRRYGITIEGAGVGDKTKLNEVIQSSDRVVKRVDDGPDVTHVMAYMFAGAGTAAALVIVITLFLIKRHDKKKDKLSGLPTGITGADCCSKDYQELCRARMAGKNAPTDGGRITALAKESERPPSSRSSTSSWNEEPALTNMDISTGHMVLVRIVCKILCKKLLINNLIYSHTWKIIYEIKVVCNENGKHFVDTKQNLMQEMLQHNQSAHYSIDQEHHFHLIIQE